MGKFEVGEIVTCIDADGLSLYEGTNYIIAGTENSGKNCRIRTMDGILIEGIIPHTSRFIKVESICVDCIHKCKSVDKEECTLKEVK